MEYQEFLEQKTHEGSEDGFSPTWMPDQLFDFQKKIIEWATIKGRSAIFADCGLGKTFMQLVWSENVARKTDGRILILTPLAVAFQTVREGEKIGVEVVNRRDGIHKGDRIVVTNYERLHYFNAEDFAGVVCDESSILKCYDGETRKAITDFMRKRPYRLLCTATAAPNDFIELGTSSEALGHLGFADMVSMFFAKSKKTYSHKEENRSGLYRFRGHAEKRFWEFVCSWAMSVRKPSDLGCSDGEFVLPALNERHHVVESNKIREGYLFDVPAVGLAEQRADLRRTITERCAMVADLANNTPDQMVAWCNLNEEGDRITRMIDDSVQVSGKDSEEHKEEAFAGFIAGDIRVLVTKPSIAGFGLNLQNCRRQTFFPSHSYEQYYQAIRRCWRFGQTRPVIVDMITTEGQADVLKNLKKKTKQAEVMFQNLVSLMNHGKQIESTRNYTKKVKVPAWL